MLVAQLLVLAEAGVDLGDAEAFERLQVDAVVGDDVGDAGGESTVGEVVFEHDEPAIRLAVGKKDKVLYEPGTKDIRIGKGIIAREGTDATIFTHGTTVAQALDAADELAKDGRSIRVVDMWTLKPIDEELIIRSAAETDGRFIVLEDHLAYGGLATRIADVVTDNGVHLKAFERLGIPQVYAGFGEDEQLRDKHGYGLEATVAALRRVIAAQP